MEKTCKFLKIASTIFKVLAWVSLGVGVISAVVILIGGGTPEAPRSAAFVGILLGVIYFFISLTISEGITLFLDIHSKVSKGSGV